MMIKQMRNFALIDAIRFYLKTLETEKKMFDWGKNIELKIV